MASEIEAEDTGPIQLIDIDGVSHALKGHVRPTTFIESELLDEALGTQVMLASETFQHTGSFKFRAALSAAIHTQADHLIAASSGNFGQALALAARRSGRRCTIAMPSQSSQVKIDAVRDQGATVDLIDTTRSSRAQRMTELAAAHPTAQIISPYDDPFVIAGNASLGVEIFEARPKPDVVVVPIGGGGLASGIVLARDKFAPECKIVGAEPLLANDAARSLRAGVISHNDREPNTICDGARTPSLGQRNFAILRRGLAEIIEVPDELVAAAVRLLFRNANLKAEPTGALSVAAVQLAKEKFAGRRVLCIVSGGNVDPAFYAKLIS